MFHYLLLLVKVVATLLLGLLQYFFSKRTPPKNNIQHLRVGIIGGGIGGVGAAWALKRGGCEHVTIFEKRDTIGGNAKVFPWPTTPSVTTGLSVLAWPDAYFHNYNQVCKFPSTCVLIVPAAYGVASAHHGC